MQLSFSRKPATDGDGEAAEAPSLTHNETLENVSAESINGKVRQEGLTGLDVSGSGLAAARVSDGRIRSASATTIDPGLVVDGEIADPAGLGSAIAEFFAANGLPNKVRMSVASPRVVIRTIETPVIPDRKEFAAAVRFQASDHIPMPLDEAVLDYQVLETIPGADTGDPPKFSVMLVAASRGLIDGLMDTARHAGIKLQGVDLAAFSLIRVMYPGDVAQRETIAYLHFGDMLNVTLARGRVCKFTRATPVGYEALIARLCERVNLTPAHAQMWLDHVGLSAPIETIEGERDIVTAARQELTDAAERVSNDVTAAIDFHSVQDSSARVSRIMLAGPGSSIPGIAEMVSQRTGLPVEVPAPLGALDSSALSGSGIDERRLTLAAGLAIEEVVAQ
ncbi:MAG: pilus assembly protein PilM [Thermoleophilaceae bacterium]|nr:pilus assembly protein PilM [Thermoleophilaceae bacterium]